MELQQVLESLIQRPLQQGECDLATPEDAALMRGFELCHRWIMDTCEREFNEWFKAHTNRLIKIALPNGGTAEDMNLLGTRLPDMIRATWMSARIAEMSVEQILLANKDLAEQVTTLVGANKALAKEADDWKAQSAEVPKLIQDHFGVEAQ